VTVFVDTSALLAHLDQSDRSHAAATAYVEGSLAEVLVTHNYVVLETAAVLKRKGGDQATRAFFSAWVPALRIHWIDPTVHATAAAAYVASLPSSVSLVDRVSFAVMRHLGISAAFAFDPHFAGEGFALVA